MSKKIYVDGVHPEETRVDEEEMYERLSAFEKSFGRKKKPAIVMISAAGHIGLDKLTNTIENKIKETESV